MLNKHLLAGSLPTLMNQYKPPIFVKSPLLSILMGCFLKGRYDVEFEREHIKCPELGNYSLDFAKINDSAKTSGIKKVMFIVPGVTGCSSAKYI